MNNETPTSPTSAPQSHPRINRSFYRCRDCSAVMATEERGLVAAGAVCSCGGKIKYMGYVLRPSSGMQIEGSECACDARCTNAPGPSCDCSCQGKNHGTQRVVKVITDVGSVPKLVSPNQDKADEYRAARAATMAVFESRYPGLIADVRDGVRRSYELWTLARIFGAEISRACKIVNHRKRIAALQTLAVKYAASESVAAA